LTEIGVWGDASCQELTRVGHCRNCEVYGASGRELLDRRAPEGYIESWTEMLARAKDVAGPATIAYVVFRVGSTWLALRAAAMREVTLPAAIRRVPHRSREVLLGLVTVRGEIHPCVSLHTLFGETAEDQPPRTARLLVTRRGQEDWVFPVDEIDGMHELDEHAVEPLPATLGHTHLVYSRGLFAVGNRAVAAIDEELLFSTLGRRIA
jgi:chemotaxis-related protein WspD